MGQLNKSQDEHGFRNVWTYDGKILFKENGSFSKTYQQTSLLNHLF